MRQQRRGSTDAALRRGGAARAPAALTAAVGQGQSPWQSPGDILAPVLDLLAAEDGGRWLRVASHVCSSWRAAALDILLADTAISKPPLEDFRAIGARNGPAEPERKVGKTDTVVTQAAMVVEASASTGMEIISKQRLDAPPQVPTNLSAAAAGAPAVGAARSLSRPRLPRAVQQQQHQQFRWHIPHVAGPAVLPGQQPLQQQQLQQQQAEAPQAPAAAAGAAAAPLPAGAAASPNRRHRPAEPQGSIQSDVVAVPGRRRAMSDSDSDDGSTLAQAGPVTRRRSRRPGRGTTRTASVEQQQRHEEQLAQAQRPQEEPMQAQQPVQTQQQQAGGADGAGPSRPATRSRKRTASVDHDRPPKRRQAGASGPGRSKAAAACRVESPCSVEGRGVPPQQRQRQKQQRREESEVSVSYYDIADAAGAHVDVGPAVQQQQQQGEVEQQQLQQQQQPVSSGRVHSMVGFVKRIMGL